MKIPERMKIGFFAYLKKVISKTKIFNLLGNFTDKSVSHHDLHIFFKNPAHKSWQKIPFSPNVPFIFLFLESAS